MSALDCTEGERVSVGAVRESSSWSLGANACILLGQRGGLWGSSGWRGAGYAVG